MVGVALGSRSGRAVLAAAVLGSGMALLDGTVVNVALVSIGRDLSASLQDLQWVTNGYLLTLASFILLGGSLGDRYGRRRVFVVGVVAFAVASAVCGVAQSPGQLIGARLVQGVGGALLTPGSLALIQATFVEQDRAKAIGTWSGMSGIASAIGPFVGGWLIQYASWRWVFLINVPLAAATVWVSRSVPESHDVEAAGRFDVPGAGLATAALAVATYGLIEAQLLGPVWTAVLVAVGVALAVAFVLVERRVPSPMLRPSLFASRVFTAANLMTLLVYAALGAVMFFLVLQLQIVLQYGPLAAGLATLPVTILMLLLAGKGGEIGTRIGPRLPMTVGPVVCALGVALLAGVGAGSGYLTGILPGVAVFGLGLCILVAPLTATVLAAVPDRFAGIASGVNNAVARAGSLLAVAALPALVGIGGDAYHEPAEFARAYTASMWVNVVLLVAGGAVSWLLVRNPATCDESGLGRRRPPQDPPGPPIRGGAV
ncbi:MFS transporter [Intrasporangium sp.]|uniref:MFS transporter n=1 Tax=Intrasporangium sp. TaxID=1925024 RepID=UPI0032213EDD